MPAIPTIQSQTRCPHSQDLGLHSINPVCFSGPQSLVSPSSTPATLYTRGSVWAFVLRQEQGLDFQGPVPTLPTHCVTLN